MGTVVRSGEFRAVVHGNEHGVPHAHVQKGNREVVITIGSADVRPSPLAGTMSTPDVRIALRLVGENQDALLAEWRRLNG